MTLDDLVARLRRSSLGVHGDPVSPPGRRALAPAPDGAVETTVLGTDLESGQVLQKAVAAGRWFGARPLPGTDWALAGCTVAPGFDFAEFELGRRDDLLARHPGAADAIRALTD